MHQPVSIMHQSLFISKVMQSVLEKFFTGDKDQAVEQILQNYNTQ